MKYIGTDLLLFWAFFILLSVLPMILALKFHGDSEGNSKKEGKKK